MYTLSGSRALSTRKPEALGVPGPKLGRRREPPPPTTYGVQPELSILSLCNYPLGGKAEKLHSRREVVAHCTALLLRDKLGNRNSGPSWGEGLVGTGCSWVLRCQGGTLGPATGRMVHSEDRLPGLECKALAVFLLRSC